MVLLNKKVKCSQVTEESSKCLNNIKSLFPYQGEEDVLL